MQYGKSDLQRGSANAIESLFGHHNLTSDAEGEEMLTVPRNKVQELYAKAKDIYDLYTNATCINSLESHAIDISTGKMKILDTLFGSKCLPDELNEDNFAKSEPKKEHDYSPNGCTHPDGENCRWKHENVECHLKNGCYYEPKAAELKFKMDEQRLYIATHITAAIYANYDVAKCFESIEAIVQKAVETADALIARCKKE